MSQKQQTVLTPASLDGRGIKFNQDTFNVDVNLDEGKGLSFTHDGKLTLDISALVQNIPAETYLTPTTGGTLVDSKINTAVSSGGAVHSLVETTSQSKASAAITAALESGGAIHNKITELVNAKVGEVDVSAQIQQALQTALEPYVKASELAAKVSEISTVTLADASGTPFAKALPHS